MCPPGTDQTRYFRQQWNILVPRIKQLQPVGDEEDMLYGPLSAIFRKTELDFWSKLAKPLVMPDSSDLMHTRQRATRSTARARDAASPCLLEFLPTELLDMVLERLQNADIMAVAMCSDILWKRAMRHVQARLESSVAPWAGMEIACTGIYLMDLPEAFEKDGLAHRSVDLDRAPGGSMCMPRQFNWAAINQYGRGVSQSAAVDDWLSLLQHHFPRKGRRDTKYISLRRYVAKFRESLIQPRSRVDGVYILRNFTTKEFVRLRYPRRIYKQPTIDVARMNWCGLNDIFLLRICWTIDGFYGRPPDKGRWAGHRFDITAASADDDQFAEWTDATLEIAEEAKAYKQASLQFRLPPGMDLVHFCSTGIYELGENNHVDYNNL